MNIFWIEVDKIRPNELQPRNEFDEERLADLAESIKQYGVLQPLTVIRREREMPTGIVVEYELIAGERRWRASKLAGLVQVPVIIRDDEGEKIKLELAIIENLQREDLNPIDRALAFKKLIEQFNLKHHEVGARVGKSRVFVSNTLRILNLPQDMQDALTRREINEGHTRPLLMLIDRPQEQRKLFESILSGKTNVREAELLARDIAQERSKIMAKINKGEMMVNRDMINMAEKLSNVLGTRVSVVQEGPKGKLSIDFFSEEEFKALMEKVLGEKLAEMKAEEKIEEKITEEAIAEEVAQPEMAAEPLTQLMQIEQADLSEPEVSQQPESTQDLIDRFTI